MSTEIDIRKTSDQFYDARCATVSIDARIVKFIDRVKGGVIIQVGAFVHNRAFITDLGVSGILFLNMLLGPRKAFFRIFRGILSRAEIEFRP
jgi:hypothetical protein